MIILYPSSGASDGFFNGVPAKERLHWRSFLVKLGADNLKGVKNEELLVACHKKLFDSEPCICLNSLRINLSFYIMSVYIVYTVLGDVSIYVVGKDEYDELALSEVIFVITLLNSLLWIFKYRNCNVILCNCIKSLLRNVIKLKNMTIKTSHQ
ncbi:hypothetical protein UlMin_026867 [Ulmus minor]